MRDAETLFDASHAKCDGCELADACKRGRSVPGTASASPNGLMIVGEEPGTTEVSRKTPFIGAAGNELNAWLEAAGLVREECDVTNAVLCLPPQGGGKGASLAKRFPHAMPACFSRLEAEIAARRPRVIVALGPAALAALGGEWTIRNKHVDVVCDVCNPETRKVGPAIECSVGNCDWYRLRPDGEDTTTWREALLVELDGKCPSCTANLRRLRAKAIRCRACGGRKKRVVSEPFYKEPPYKLLGKNGIAGALFEAAALPHRWDRFGVRYVVATLHPSYVLRTEHSDENRKGLVGQFAARVVVDHLEKAKRLLRRDHRFGLTVTLTDSAEDVIAFTKEPGLYEIDLETNAKSPWDVSEVRCIGIGKPDTEEVLVVDTRHLVEARVTVGADGGHVTAIRVLDAPLHKALCDFLERADAGKETQNGEYEAIVVRRLWGVRLGPLANDSMLAHRVLWPDEPHGLGHIASEMTEVPYWKPPKSTGGVDSFETFTDLAVYNAKDVRTTGASIDVMAGPALPAPVMLDLPMGVRVPTWRRGGKLVSEAECFGAYALDMALYPTAIQMQIDGIPLNEKALREIGEEQQPKADALHEWLVEYIGTLPPKMHHDGKMKRYGVDIPWPKDRIKLSSSTQLAWALYDPNGPCKLVCPSKTATGAPSTEKDVLAKLASHEFVHTLLRWRDIDKTLSTFVYGKGLILREDGRIHPTWKFTPVTGRWSSEPNFQNWPIWLRAAVQAPPGWVIVGADESQLEIRIMGGLSGDPELIRRCIYADEKRKLEPEWDPHSFVASHFFGRAFTELRLDDPTEAKRRKALREVIKSVIYGMNYGAGAAKVLETIYKKGYTGVPLTLQIIKQAIEVIFRLFPGILRWREATLEHAMATGEVRDVLLGRWRFFPKEVPAPVAWNHPIQSTGAAIVNLGFYRYAQELPRVSRRAFPIAQVHDAVYTLCPEEDAERVMALKEEKLTTELVLADGAAPMKFVATAKRGTAWDQVS